jgi:D-serine deaminase-like pyridoxal phosphate-dependent protein
LFIVSDPSNESAIKGDLPMSHKQSFYKGYAGPVDAATPCFVVFEDVVRANLLRTIEATGGASRLMPHVKTHRASWIVRLFIAHGVTNFKCATPAEVELLFEAGATHVVWAYPTPNRANIQRVIEIARRFPAARVAGMADSWPSLEAWESALANAPGNVRLRIDLDPGMGRSGIALTTEAVALSKRAHSTGRFDGWHFYDGHNRGPAEMRRAEVERMSDQLDGFLRDAADAGVPGDVIAGGSYSFNLWRHPSITYVSPGSFTYSSTQHQTELPELGWEPAAFVLTSVVSVHQGTATLDAGAKAISPDKPLKDRFRGPGEIMMMNEEHCVIEASGLSVGDQVYLIPGHACTTAYLYDRALVRTAEGVWESRPQLGSAR